MCPNWGRKKWATKMLRRLKISKSKYGFHAVQKPTQNKSGKQRMFLVFFLKLKPGEHPESYPSMVSS